MKKLSLLVKQKLTNHDAFLWMVRASILYPDKFDIEKIAKKYYKIAFPENQFPFKEIDSKVIDEIRLGLLMSSGVGNLFTKRISFLETYLKRL